MKNKNIVLYKNNFKIVFLRFFLFFILLFILIFCSIEIFRILKNNENENEKNEYLTFCKQFQERFLQEINLQILSLSSFSQIISFSCPYHSNWPNCSFSLTAFSKITKPIIELASIRGISFSPILSINQIHSFESFAYSFFEEEGYEELGISSFGKGIFGINNQTNERYHDIGQHIIGKRSISVPVMEIECLKENEVAVMYNLYSEFHRAYMIDYLIDCHESGKKGRNCTSITNIIQLIQDSNQRPSSLIAFPITPLYNSTLLVGIAVEVLNWDVIISNSASNVNSMIIILQAPDNIKYSYKIKHGNIFYLGIGDYHNIKYSNREWKFPIYLTQNYIQSSNFISTITTNPPSTSSSSSINTNNIFMISIYPTEEYLSQYHTNNPIYITMISVGIVVFTSIIFFIYDFFVKRDSIEKDTTIHSKRLFVRYIGHEIRTPLNTVHLGTKLLIDEIQQTYYDIKNNPTSYTIKSIIEYFSEWIHLAHEVESSSDTAITVLNDLLDYDKISGSGLKIESEPVSLWDIVYKSVNPFNVQAKHAGVNLILDLAILRKVSLRNIYNSNNNNNNNNNNNENNNENNNNNLDIEENNRKEQMSKLAVLGDPVKLSHVIRNLVSNALKFTPKGGTITIQVYWDEQSDFLPSSYHTSGCNKIIPHPYRSESRETSEHSVMNNNLPLPTTTTISPDFQRAGSIICLVTDTGYGMTSEQLKNLFQEGMQFNANKLQGGGGSGLGLWISKGVVTLHNGKLTAKSDGEGKGSTFKLELPVYLLPTPLYNIEEAIKLHRLQELTFIETNHIQNLHLPPENTNHSNSLLPSTARSYLTQRDINLSTNSYDNDHSISISSVSNLESINPVVLVVDDVASSRKIVCRLLRKEGCICYEAVDGQECLEILELHGIQNNYDDNDNSKENNNMSNKIIHSSSSSPSYPPFDLIFLDYEMPRIDGPSAARIIRQKGYKIPIIGLTGNVMDEDTEYFINNGVSMVLHKPLTINSMHHCLEVYGPKKNFKISNTLSLPLTSLSEGDSGRVHQVFDEQEKELQQLQQLQHRQEQEEQEQEEIEEYHV